MAKAKKRACGALEVSSFLAVSGGFGGPRREMLSFRYGQKSRENV
jgi:hypothetical protein